MDRKVDCSLAGFLTGIPVKGESPLGTPLRPVPSETAAWLQPTWIATWVAQAYGALVLLPVWLPVYGERLPNWVWIGVPVQIFGWLVISAYLAVRKREGVYRFAVAAFAASGTSFIFPIGLHVLATTALEPWVTVGLAGFGVFCLGILAFIERLGFILDAQARIRGRDSQGIDPTRPGVTGGQKKRDQAVLLATLVALVLVILAMVLIIGLS